MMNKIFKNISIKFLSFAIAFVAWLIIMNLKNPMVSGFVSVPVAMENEDYILSQNKTYTVLGSRVIKVNYMVQANYQTSIHQNDFNVYVDLKDLETTNSLPIHVVASEDVERHTNNIFTEPSVLQVELNDASRKEFEVQYVISGNLGEGHSLGKVFLTPNIVYISGRNEAVEEVDHVSIEIPINNREETFSGESQIVLYDKDANILSKEGLSISPETVAYSVFIDSVARANISVTTEGNVKTGYTYAGLEVEPSSIMISGLRGIIQNIYNIDLPTINIDGLDQNTEYIFTTSGVLPNGIISDTTAIKVTVLVNENILTNSARNREEVGPHLETTETTASSENLDSASDTSESNAESNLNMDSTKSE